ncbi:hypothetical protein [Terrabacter sp. RAF57]|uniref:hypothetical protein n=1 Tax=Terrabacter sp. RAF57 TaxID=3233063 RepID=UPI003F994CD7
MSRARTLRIALGLIVAGLLLLFIVVPPATVAVPPGMEQGLRIVFGLGREARTAVKLVDACDAARENAKPPTDLVEASNGTCVKPTGTTTPKASERPAILSTSLLGDLVACGDEASTRTVPSAQLTVSSELVGVTGLRYTMTADPASPVEVAPGAYCGRLVVERAAGPYRSFPALVLVDDRMQPFAVGKALALLVVGAGIGLLIRLLNDPFGKLLRITRRLDRIRRWLASGPTGYDDQAMAGIQRKIDDANAAIKDLDTDGADEIVTDLESAQKVTPEAGREILAQTRPARAQLPDPSHPAFWLIRHYWAVALGAILVVVAATGVWTQYIGNNAFEGSTRDWAGLVIFALAAQVTVSGLTEALGKLAPGSK